MWRQDLSMTTTGIQTKEMDDVKVMYSTPTGLPFFIREKAGHEA